MSTQTSETLNQRIIEIASHRTDVPKEQIMPESRFAADLGYDSLDFVDFAMNIEDEFNIAVPDKEIDNIVTVQDAIEAVQKLTL